MTISTRNKLDKIRGDMSRSEWLRHVVVQQIEGQHEWVESLPEAPPLVNETKPMVMPRPKPKIQIVPEKPHRHLFEKGDEAGRKMVGRMNVPLYLYMCECGETEVR